MLQVGPISIPVAMFTAARGERISFNMLHSRCRSKVSQAGYYCPCCVEVMALEDFSYQPAVDLVAYKAAIKSRKEAVGKLKKGDAPIPEIAPVPVIEVAKGEIVVMHIDDVNNFELSTKIKNTENVAMVQKDDIIKGYEVTKNNFVVVSADEIAAQKPQSGSAIQFQKFIPLSQLNPIYFESSYYLAPDDNVRSKSYSVLREGLRSRGVAIVAKVTMRQSESVVFIVAHPDGGMIAYTAYLADEVRQISFQSTEVSDAERDAVSRFIDAKTSDLNMSEYRDSYRENMTALIQAKQEHRELPAVEQLKPKPPVSDNLIEMLNASVEMEKQKKKSA